MAEASGAQGAATGTGPGGGAKSAADAAGGRRRGLLGILLPLILAPLLGAAGYFAVDGGHVLGPIEGASALLAPSPPGTEGPAPVAYVPLPRLTISLGPSAAARHLRVTVTLEVEPGTEAAVTEVSPRLIAALTRFLRAVDERDFEQPALMARLQEQLLRRLEFNAPPGALRAVLFQEFLLN
ncbi:MAG: flagellar basal body-associated FliL family protein [Pseudomonadota bacterium]